MTAFVSPADRSQTIRSATSFAHLSRDSAIFALGSIAGKLVALVTLPVFTRLMTPTDYGRLDLLSTLGSAAISVLSLGMDVVSIRLTMDPTRTAEQRRATLGAWFLVGTVVASTAALVAVLTAPIVSGVLFGNDDHALSVGLLAIVIGAGVLQVQGLTVLRIQGRPFAYSGIVTGALVLNAALAILFLVLWTRDERAPLLALGVSWAVGAAATAIVAGRGAIRRPRTDDVSELLTLALPLLPALLATWIAEFGNRAILLSTSSAAELGYLAIGLRLSSIGGLVVIAFQLAWQPRALALDTSRAGLERMAADARSILMICAVAVASVAIVTPELVLFWSGPAFGAALPVTGICLIGTICSAAMLVASLPSLLVKRTLNLTLAGVLGAGVGLSLNFVLAPRLGAEGAATSIALGQATTATVAWRLGTRGLDMPRMWGRPLAMMALAVCVAIVATFPAGGAPIWIRGLMAVPILASVWRDGTIRSTIRAFRGLA